MDSLHLYNTRTRNIERFTPLNTDCTTIYSCGPTVYDYVHIGNLSAFIAADTLRRVAATMGDVHHAMNFTDVDDKTIRRSRETYPDLDPIEALRTLTVDYGNKFLEDMAKIGNDVEAIDFIKATDPATLDGMRSLITELHQNGFAYLADDGVYFNIDAYRKSGKKYGQLVELSDANTSSERIQNDEYDKDSAHDFALWKKKRTGEPSWEFELDGTKIDGRPGWHIECSVMSHLKLGQPFDIHTGGIDLAFPHHENEIAQSTAGHDNPTYANFFVHNEHILIDGKKMSKSLNNFYTLQDLMSKGVDPLAFRLLVLQSHYRKSTNFSLDNAEATHNRLHHWRNVAALRHQTHTANNVNDAAVSSPSHAAVKALTETLYNDLDTPAALAFIDSVFHEIGKTSLSHINRTALIEFLEYIDELLGLQLIHSTPDISDEQKQLLLERTRARDNKDWQLSDELRDALLEQNILVRDTASGSIWEYKK